VVDPSPQEKVTFVTLLRQKAFAKFFVAQFVSSLGDWIGVIAIAILAQDLGGPTGVGVVMTARVIPGFIVGPLAGVLADRWDRKRTMVLADAARAAIIFSLPLFPNLVYLLIASMLLESLSLIWGPAKDASLPHVVPPRYLTHANSLSLIAVYGPWPLASLVYIGLSTLAGWAADAVPALSGLQGEEVALALWVDSATFMFSALTIWTLTIPASTHRAGRLDFGEVKRDLFEGLRFVIDHDKVRPWIIGIAFTFTAAGGVFSLGPGFVTDVLNAGDRGFSFVIGFLAAGMIIGLLVVGVIAKRVQKDVLFSAALLLLGVSLALLASMGSLEYAIPVASMLGFFGGAAYSTGYALMHENTADEMRGRTFSAAYTTIRIGTLLGLGLFPFVAGAFGDRVWRINESLTLELPGTRVTLWIAGTFVLAGGVYSMRAIKDRWGGGRASGGSGFFVVFEGGEGAGKSTQMDALVKWLRGRGEDVVSTREPGGTEIGDRIRAILLDTASGSMDERTEALLYAADRAQHVAEVVKPSLDAGKIVVSDRFIDSSLAYQGLARGLGLDRIYQLSEWATGGLLPDLVFFMRLDPDEGLKRVGGGRDRIEQEADVFHHRVMAAYLELAQKFPGRFVVLDASRSKDEIRAEIQQAFLERARDVIQPIEPGTNMTPPGPVVR
jgi:dTMP kinase